MRKLFVLVLLTLFSSLVLAIPPAVDFNYTPASPITDQNITFDPIVTNNGTVLNMQWQFGADGNVNSYPDQNTQFDSNFNTTFTGWQNVEGTWNNSGGLLVANAGDGTLQRGIHYSSSSAAITANTRMSQTGSGTPKYCWNEPSSGPGGGICNNYGIWVNSGSGNIQFRYGTTLLLTLLVGYVNGQLYDINVIRTSDGNYSFYIDGSYKGSIVDTTSDTNGNFAKLVYGDGGGSGRYGYSQLFSGGAVNTDTNQIHAFNTGGARDVCLTVGNVDGNTTACHTVNVTATPPTVDFTFTPASPSAFQTVTFNPDINANGTINNMRWMFDSDGNTNYFAPPPIDIDLNQSHSFTTGGTKTVCLTAGNNDANVTACHNVSVAQSISFVVRDENTHAIIPFPVAVVNDTTFYGDVNGTVNILTPTVSQESVVSIYATNYPARSFTYLLDINASLQENIYLLDSTKGRYIDFLLRDINSVKYPDYLFRIVKDGNIVSRVYSSDIAITPPIWLANIATDYNYFFDINTQSGTNVYSYGNTTLTIQIPFNEVTITPVTPFGIQVSDNASIDLNNLSASRAIRIYPNTFHPYAITIDANTLAYFNRYYNLRSLGGQTTKTLQPYMLQAIDNGIPATMIVKDSLTSLSLQYYLFEFYTDVNSMANVLVESPQADSAGAFIFTTVTGKNYFLKIYNPYGDLIKQGNFISSTSTTYYLDLSTGVILGSAPVPGIVDVNLLIPTQNFFFLNDSNNFGIRFIVNSTGPIIEAVNVRVTTSGTTLHNQTFTPTFPAVQWNSGTAFDANFSTSLNNINTQLVITVQTDDGNTTESYMFPLKQDSNPTVSFPGFGTFCSNVGGLGCALIWLLIGLMISIGLRFNPIFGVDNNGMFWVMAIWTGVAAFIGLVPYLIGFIAILAGASFWAIRNRPIG